MSDATRTVATATLAVAGDVMLGRLVDEAIRERGAAWPWGNMRSTIRAADAFLVNLECAITRRLARWDEGYGKPYYFRADPRAIETLRRGGVDFASVANNHVADFGREGLLDTLAALDRSGVAHAGAGRDLGTARAPALLSVGPLRIAIVAFADYPASWAATADTPGIAFVDIEGDPEDVVPVAAIREAARHADLVVLSVHWGPNMSERPSPPVRRLARRAIEAGAALVWGHSAHVVQGIEFVARGGDRTPGVVLFDTGDFVDDFAVIPGLRNDLGSLFRLDVSARGVERVTLDPVRIARLQVNRARRGDREWFRQRMAARCAELGTRIVDREDGSLAAIAEAATG